MTVPFLWKDFPDCSFVALCRSCIIAETLSWGSSGALSPPISVLTQPGSTENTMRSGLSLACLYVYNPINWLSWTTWPLNISDNLPTYSQRFCLCCRLRFLHQNPDQSSQVRLSCSGSLSDDSFRCRWRKFEQVMQGRRRWLAESWWIPLQRSWMPYHPLQSTILRFSNLKS